MTERTSHDIELRDRTRVSFVDFEAHLQFEMEGPERTIREAREWLNELLEAAYKLRNVSPTVPPAHILLPKPAHTESEIRGSKAKRPKRKSYPAPSNGSNSVIPELEPVDIEVAKSLVVRYAGKSSGEDCVLWIAYFLKDQLGISEFSVPLVQSVYDSILSAGAQVAPIKNITKTIQNMIPRSRKKMWVRSLGSGKYGLTSNGILVINAAKQKAEGATA